VGRSSQLAQKSYPGGGINRLLQHSVMATATKPTMFSTSTTLPLPTNEVGGNLSLTTLSVYGQRVTEYMEEAPHRVNVACFTGGVIVILNGLFGVLDIFDVFDHFIYYVVNAYMVFFGVVTCISEIHPDVTPMHDHLQGIQVWMHDWAKGLTLLWGRGAFYIFQGLLILFSSTLISVGLVIGIYMLIMGAINIKLHFKRHPRAVREDYIRVTD